MITFEQFARDAGIWLLQTSLAAALLIVLVLAIQILFGRFLSPRWTYALWLLVAVRLVLPSAPESRISIFNLHSPAEIQPSIPMESLPELATVAGTLKMQPAIERLPPRLDWRVLLIGLWLTGATGYFLCCALQYRRLRVWVRRQPPIHDPAMIATLRSAQETLGFRRNVFLIKTHSLAAPCVMGIFRPVLLLPKTLLLETWNTRELELVFLHELIHVRRRDNLLNWFLICVQALHWFNPLVWFALKRLRTERELLCDAIALVHLHPEVRPSYGATLLKIAEEAAHFRFAPGVVPILNHKHQLQRRITMIARFKPTARLATAAGIALILALACLTFTAATPTEKAAAERPKPNAAPKNEVAVSVVRELQHQSNMKTLEMELNRVNSQIQEAEATMDELRHRHGIPSHIAHGDGTQPGPETENIRKFAALRAEAAREQEQFASLYNSLKSLDRPALKQTIATAVPDTHLSLLSERLAEYEQKFASLIEIYSLDHPEVKGLKRMIDQINRQVNDRLDGILQGLKVKTESIKAAIERIDKELEQLKSRDLQASSDYREYFRVKREWQNLLSMRDRLRLRILEERLDHALPRPANRPAQDSEPQPTSP